MGERGKGGGGQGGDGARRDTGQLQQLNTPCQAHSTSSLAVCVREVSVAATLQLVNEQSEESAS